MKGCLIVLGIALLGMSACNVLTLGGSQDAVVGGLAIAFITGLIGVAMLVAGARRHGVAPTRKCPHCAETILAAANVCRYCNRDVPS